MASDIIWKKWHHGVCPMTEVKCSVVDADFCVYTWEDHGQGKIEIARICCCI